VASSGGIISAARADRGIAGWTRPTFETSASFRGYITSSVASTNKAAGATTGTTSRDRLRTYSFTTIWLRTVVFITGAFSGGRITGALRAAAIGTRACKQIVRETKMYYSKVHAGVTHAPRRHSL
jgi:hypothetical protein